MRRRIAKLDKQLRRSQLQFALACIVDSYDDAVTGDPPRFVNEQSARDFAAVIKRLRPIAEPCEEDHEE